MRQFAAHGRPWPLPNLAARATRELFPGACKVAQPLTVLALTPHRFMDDLAALSETGQVRVLAFPEYWQFAPLSWFSGAYFELAPERQTFLQQFLRDYLALIGADCLVSTAIWYRQDVPWGAAAQAIGVPFVVFHKESYKATPSQQETTIDRARVVGRFSGAHVIVHNETIRQVLLRSEFVEPQQISALGAMRMDGLVTTANEPRPLAAGNQCATLFSFTHGVGLDELGFGQWPKNPYVGWIRLFEQTHAAFARFAQAHPQLECVIKTKWSGKWFTAIEQALKANGLDAAAIPNLRLVYDENPHALMKRSRIVCGYNSTTLLESGILGMPVIVPRFAEAADPRYALGNKLPDAADAFEVADSPEVLADLLSRRLDAPQVDAAQMQRRRELFERWISPLDGPATPRYLNLLRTLVEQPGANQLLRKVI